MLPADGVEHLLLAVGIDAENGLEIFCELGDCVQVYRKMFRVAFVFDEGVDAYVFTCSLREVQSNSQWTGQLGRRGDS